MNWIMKYITFLFLFVGMSVRGLAQETILPAIQKQKAVLKCHPEDTKALKELCFLYLYKSDYRKAIEYGEKLFQLGYKKQDYKFSILYAHIGLGQAYVMLGDTSAINHLGQAMLLAKSEKNDSALCSVYNGMGLYTSNIHKDYYSALHYFFEGIEAAHRCHYKELEAILLGNISSIYFLKEDPVGLTYSLQTYEMGHEQNSAYLIFIGALNASYMYYLLHDYDKALPYIKEAEFIMKQNEYYNQGNVYAIYGMIEFAKGNRQQAIEYYKKGLALNDMNQTSYKVLLLNEYAIALAEEGKNQQAIDLLFKALAFTKEENCEIYRNRVINTLSVCYENMGQYVEALAWQRKLQQETDSIFNTDKEKVLSELRIKYDTEHQANEIRKNKLILLQKEKKGTGSHGNFGPCVVSGFCFMASLQTAEPAVHQYCPSASGGDSERAAVEGGDFFSSGAATRSGFRIGAFCRGEICSFFVDERKEELLVPAFGKTDAGRRSL